MLFCIHIFYLQINNKSTTCKNITCPFKDIIRPCISILVRIQKKNCLFFCRSVSTIGYRNKKNKIKNSQKKFIIHFQPERYFLKTPKILQGGQEKRSCPPLVLLRNFKIIPRKSESYSPAPYTVPECPGFRIPWPRPPHRTDGPETARVRTVPSSRPHPGRCPYP